MPSRAGKPGRNEDEMKKQTKWSKRNRKLVDNETPFVEIDIIKPNGDTATIRMYWTKSGVYGPQVATFLYADGDVWTHRTTGCGYSKKNFAFACVMRHLGLGIQGPKGPAGGDFLPYMYAVGGNYWRVDLRGPAVQNLNVAPCPVCGAEYGKVHQYNCPQAKNK